MYIFTVKDGALAQEWTEQSSTHLIILAHGYSGNGTDKDDPNFVSVKDHGPIPPGMYTIGEAVEGTHLGALALPLVPDDDNIMFGRKGFYCHGDSISHPGDASDGCIIMPRNIRLRMSQDTDRRLKVVGW